MKTTLVLIRHGLTDWNSEGRWQGHQDIPLNETGIAQAQALARRLAKWPIEALYSSDLKRAAQTAHILGAAIDLEPALDASLRERDVGDYQGLTWKEIEMSFPNEFQEMRAGTFTVPNGEDNHNLHNRAMTAINSIAKRHTGQMVAIVSHGVFIKSALLHFLGLPIGHYGLIGVRGNTSINIVEINKGKPCLSRLNDTAHLESY